MDAHAPQKNNTLNTIGIVTVGIVGSVFVYVSIVALQALYVSETAPVATQKAFGAQGEIKDSLKAEQMGNINDPRIGAVYGPANTQLYGVGITAAKALIIRDGKDPAHLVPAIGASDQPNIAPAFGRPQPLQLPPTTPPGTDTPAGDTPPGGAPPAAGALPGAAPTTGTTPAASGAPMPTGNSGQPATGNALPDRSGLPNAGGNPAPTPGTAPAGGSAAPTPSPAVSPPAAGAAPAAGATPTR